MNTQEILAASNTLGELTDQFLRLPEFKEKGVEAALFIQLANAYLCEYIKHVNDGLDNYDALVATVKGELKVSESKQTLLKLLGPTN